MSGNCDDFKLEEIIEYPTKRDYIVIHSKLFDNKEIWFLIMSLFWRYEFE